MLGASLLTLLGFLCGYLIHNRMLPIWRSVDALTLFLFTLPGTVVGIGLISLWNTPISNFIYRTPAIIILGYLAQYTVLPARTTTAILAQDSAFFRTGGPALRCKLVHDAAGHRSAIGTTWPNHRMDCQLRVLLARSRREHGGLPTGLDTLPVRILTLMANGAPRLIAALCVILIAVTLIPLGAVALWPKRGLRSRL